VYNWLSVFGRLALLAPCLAYVFSCSFSWAQNSSQPPTQITHSQFTPQFPKTLEELSSYKFKHDEILGEYGVPYNQESKKNLATMTSWIRKDLSAFQRNEISAICSQKFQTNFRSTEISADNFCVPWVMEQLYIEYWKNRKIPQKPQLIQQVTSTDAWNELANKSFNYSFQRLDVVSLQDLKKMFAISKSTEKDCRYAPAAGALLARTETFFPDPQAFLLMESLYKQVFNCLNPDAEGFEYLHSRVGLVRLLRGEGELAKRSLLMASRAEDPAEDFRTLFWLGVLENNPSNNFWKELRTKYPLAIHSVISSHAAGIDPYDKISQVPNAPILRRVSSTWREFNLSSFVFELLLASEDSAALNTWGQFIGKFVDSPNSESLLYMAWCQAKAQNFRHTISHITRYLREKEGVGISTAVLDLYFPRAFSDLIMKNSQELDPVLAFALIRQESAFDPLAKSPADAYGLMQLLPVTAKQFVGNEGAKNLFDPLVNVTAGVGYLQSLLKKYNGKVEDVLASYNAGPRSLDKWRLRYQGASTLLFSDLVPFKETRGYISIIQRNAYWYGRLMDIQKDSLASVMKIKSSQAKWRSETVYNLLNMAWSNNLKKTAQLEEIFKLNEPKN
jgi:soluble lytic murein transglycosylase